MLLKYALVLSAVLALAAPACATDNVPLPLERPAHFQNIQKARIAAKGSYLPVDRSEFAAATATPAATPAPAPTTTTPKKVRVVTVQQVQQNPLIMLQQFTNEDLTAAIAMANAQVPPDAAAVTCYTAVQLLVNGGLTNPLPTGIGVFQALQAARNAKQMLSNLSSTTGPLAGFNNSCAPIILDAQNTLIMLGVGVGVVANPAVAAAVGGSGGAIAGLTGINAAVAAFIGLK